MEASWFGEHRDAVAFSGHEVCGEAEAVALHPTPECLNNYTTSALRAGN